MNNITRLQNRRERATRNATLATVRSAITQMDALPKVIPVGIAPPQVNLDPPRYVTIVGSFEANSESTPTSYDTAALFANATDQLGTNSSRRLLVQSVKIWSSPTGTNLSGTITLIDKTRGISSKDSGVASNRASCGIRYPPNIQPYVFSGTGNVDLVDIDSPSEGGVIHTLCKVWA